MIQRFAAGAALAAAFAVVSAAQPASPPDLAIVNARVYTGEAARPWAEGVSIRANRIAAVGTTSEIKAAGAARTIDAAGRLLIPGFNDAHAHPGAMPEATKLEGPPAVEHDPTLDEVIARHQDRGGRDAAGTLDRGRNRIRRARRSSRDARDARSADHRPAPHAHGMDRAREHLQFHGVAHSGRQRDGARSTGRLLRPAGRQQDAHRAGPRIRRLRPAPAPDDDPGPRRAGEERSRRSPPRRRRSASLRCRP